MTRDLSEGWLTTRDCAAQLGVSVGFVRGEIREGRLGARQLDRPGKRIVYRISSRDFRSYLLRHWRPLTAGKTSAQSA